MYYIGYIHGDFVLLPQRLMKATAKTNADWRGVRPCIRSRGDETNNVNMTGL